MLNNFVIGSILFTGSAYLYWKTTGRFQYYLGKAINSSLSKHSIMDNRNCMSDITEEALTSKPIKVNPYFPNIKSQLLSEAQRLPEWGPGRMYQVRLPYGSVYKVREKDGQDHIVRVWDDMPKDHDGFYCDQVMADMELLDMHAYGIYQKYHN